MDFSGGGTAVMVALAAVLWFLYLVPTWIRRREYFATERNATRLQRAIRVMAETAELPQEVRVEATARDAAQQEKLLAAEQRRADALARAEVRAASLRARAAEAQADELERAGRARAMAPAAPRDALVRERLRRARRVAGLLLSAALAVGLVQLWLVATTGASVGSWVVFAACAGVIGVSLGIQRRIVERMSALAGSAPVAARGRASTTLIDAELRAEAPREWTPVPIPKPLYLERGEAPRVPLVPAASAEELLREAAAESERALVAAHAEPEVVAFPAPSRFASMGIVEPAASEAVDLDEVLRRRRSAAAG